MFFSHNKPTALIHVLPDALVWYGPDRKPAELPLPPEVFCYLEVANESKARKLLQDFIMPRVSKNQKVTLILSDGVIFSTVLQANKSLDLAKAAQDFIDAIPLDPPAKAAISVPGRTNWFAVGTNKQWLGLIAQAVRQASGAVTHIIPMGSFGLSDSQKLTPQSIDQLLGPNKTAERFDFLPLLDKKQS